MIPDREKVARTLTECLYQGTLPATAASPSQSQGMRRSFNTDSRGLARPSPERGTARATEFFWASELSQASQSPWRAPTRKMEVPALTQCQQSRPI